MSVYLSRIYTKTGDKGQTALVGGKMVAKDSPRIEAYGNVDELNAVLGIVRKANREEAGPEPCKARIDAILQRAQNELFNLGSLLATLPEDLDPKQPRVEARHVEALEHDIDELNENLPPLRSFTLPGGGWVSSYLHLARTVCRRAERAIVALGPDAIDPLVVVYMNRLSDLLFVMARAANARAGAAETEW
jgi:cob(I)alamin adenosyltransferase